jgi:hypothetical protein
MGGALWLSANEIHDRSEVVGKIICALALLPLCLSVLNSVNECHLHRHVSQLNSEVEGTDRSNKRGMLLNP